MSNVDCLCWICIYLNGILHFFSGETEKEDEANERSNEVDWLDINP